MNKLIDKYIDIADDGADFIEACFSAPGKVFSGMVGALIALISVPFFVLGLLVRLFKR